MNKAQSLRRQQLLRRQQPPLWSRQRRRLQSTHRAFTLIELMIVIAVMGIVLSGLWQPVADLWHAQRDGSETVAGERALTLVFKEFRRSLRAVPTFVGVSPDLIELPSGARWKRIRRINRGRAIRFEDATGRGVTMKLPVAVRFHSFIKLDDRHVFCQIDWTDQSLSLPITWRFGR